MSGNTRQFYQLPKSMLRELGAKGSALLLWTLVWDWTKDDRPCFMSNARLAKELGLSERQVKNIVKQLEDEGWLVRWYESINGSSPRRCLRAVLKSPGEEGNMLPHKGDEAPNAGKEAALVTGTEVPCQGEVSFTHTRTDTTSITTSSIKEDDGIQEQVELWYRELGKNSGVSQTTTKEWCRSFCSDFLKNGVMVDKNGKPVMKREAYVTKNFEFRLVNSKQNFYQRSKRVFDPVQAKRDIMWHHKRYHKYQREGKQRQAQQEEGAIQRLKAELEHHGYTVDDDA